MSQEYTRAAVPRSRLFAGCFLALLSAVPVWGELKPSQVLILVNRDEPLSLQVAQMYQRFREIPSTNILRLALGSERQITATQYWRLAGEPLRRYLEEHPEIRCILTTAGVPYTVLEPGGTDEGAAFDNELAVVLREQPGDHKRRQPNPLYLHGMNPYGITDPRVLKMVYVARLDGPDLPTINRMVADANAVELKGLHGLVAGDAQGIDGVTGYGEGDASIRAVVDRLGGAGFPTALDMKQETWLQPKGGVGTQAAGAAFYIGWYALLNFQDVFGAQGLAQGAIAWHIASQEAQDIWNPKGSGWCVNLMRRGATITLGPVREPYVAAFPHGDVLVEGLLRGLTVAESYWLSLPHVSWAMVLLGDPLYRPFLFKPPAALIARSYEAASSSRVLEPGKPSPLLVQLECVGPTGASTPPLSATAEPEMGLAAASGSVAIPALKTGQSVVVQVPSVTAGNDSTGMFRLRLEARAENEPPRRIVVEGRIGFSRLTGGFGPKSQMFVNPNGDTLISGLPGRSALVQISTLRDQIISLPQDFALTTAEFSPDGGHVALAILDAKNKQAGVLITDDKLHGLQTLPPGSRFLRWLESDRILLASQGGALISHSVSGGEDRSLGQPEGRTGNVIPGTDIRFSITTDGRVLVKKGEEPDREVLRSTKVNRFIAVANDLSVFGGVDAENRLWIQQKWDGEPKVISEGVERVLWGPISRRAVVQGPNGRSRLYDNRDGSWKDLGIVLQAEWSPDEEELMFVDGDGTQPGYLSLLSGKSLQQLCAMTRIGQVAKLAFSANQSRAFLLATLGGQMDVWMTPLPRGSAGK